MCKQTTCEETTIPIAHVMTINPSRHYDITARPIMTYSTASVKGSVGQSCPQKLHVSVFRFSTHPQGRRQPHVRFWPPPHFQFSSVNSISHATHLGSANANVNMNPRLFFYRRPRLSCTRLAGKILSRDEENWLWALRRRRFALPH